VMKGLLEITNLSGGSGGERYQNPDPRMPQHPARVLLVGESGSGKTNLLVNMLSKGWMVWDRLILCLKNPDQPVWENLIDKVREGVEDINMDLEEDSGSKGQETLGAKHSCLTTLDPEYVCTLVEDLNNIPSIESLDGSIQNDIVFDDFVSEPKHVQLAITSYWVRSRHKNVSCYYLSQTFYTTPKDIRLNSTYFILFGGMPITEIDRVYKDVSAGGVTKEQFRRYYEIATRDIGQDLMESFQTSLKRTSGRDR